MTPQNTTVADGAGGPGGVKSSRSMPLGRIRTSARGARRCRASRSFSFTTSTVAARSEAVRSKAASTRASRRYTHDFGGAATAARARHFSESTSTMSSTQGKRSSGARSAYFAMPLPSATTTSGRARAIAASMTGPSAGASSRACVTGSLPGSAVTARTQRARPPTRAVVTVMPRAVRSPVCAASSSSCTSETTLTSASRRRPSSR